MHCPRGKGNGFTRSLVIKATAGLQSCPPLHESYWKDVTGSLRKKRNIVLVEQIEPRIFLIRGQRVICDADLAELYGTTTKALNPAVKRNQERFPADFMFQLTAEEARAVRLRFAAASKQPRTPVANGDRIPAQAGYSLAPSPNTAVMAVAS